MPDPGSKAAQPVTFEISTLAVWGMAGSGYSVKLIGEIDERWIAAFSQARQALGHRTEFHLDPAHGVIAFSNVGQGDSQEVLAELRSLLDLTNRWGGRRTPEYLHSHAAADEDTPRLTKPRVPILGRGQQGPYWMTREDSRGSSRMAKCLMVEFAAEDPFGRDFSFTGMTRDLSATGVFVNSSRLPSVGDRLSLIVHLTPRNRVALEGEVVRVLGRDEARDLDIQTGFAARVSDPSGNYAKLVEMPTKAM